MPLSRSIFSFALAVFTLALAATAASSDSLEKRIPQAVSSTYFNGKSLVYEFWVRNSLLFKGNEYLPVQYIGATFPTNTMVSNISLEFDDSNGAQYNLTNYTLDDDLLSADVVYLENQVTVHGLIYVDLQLEDYDNRSEYIGTLFVKFVNSTDYQTRNYSMSYTIDWSRYAQSTVIETCSGEAPYPTIVLECEMTATSNCATLTTLYDSATPSTSPGYCSKESWVTIITSESATVTPV